MFCLPWYRVCCVLCTERQDEVVYYDAYESPDALQATDDTSLALAPLRDEVTQLQLRTRQLEARRGRITAKKAYLKTKKVPANNGTEPNAAHSQQVLPPRC